MKKSAKKKKGGRPRKAIGAKFVAIAVTVSPDDLKVIDRVAVPFAGDRSKALRHIVGLFGG